MQQYNLQLYLPERDEAAVYQLWQRTLGNSWPIDLPRLRLVLGGPHAQHFVVRAGEQVIGFTATLQGSQDSARIGHLIALLVDPQKQGQGIGSALYEAALTHLRASNVNSIQLGGLVPRFWCGLPANLGAARPFFEQRGWQFDHSVFDLVRDLHTYVTPERVNQRMQNENILFETATPENIAEVFAFEAREFPNWLMHYERGAHLGDFADILIARDPHKGIVGTLFMSSPRSHSTRTDLVWQTLLGQDAGSIGAVGVAESERGRGIGIGIVARASEILKERGVGNCYIDWVVLTDFYAKLGYDIWREYWPSWRIP